MVFYVHTVDAVNYVSEVFRECFTSKAVAKFHSSLATLEDLTSLLLNDLDGPTTISFVNLGTSSCFLNE